MPHVRRLAREIGATKHDVEVNRVAAGFKAAASLPAASPLAWFRAVTFLEQIVTSASKRGSGRVAGLDRFADAQVFVGATASLFEDWPNAFECVLRECLSENTRCMSIQRTFDPVYRILYKELRSPDFDLMRAAFEAFLHEHWWGLIDRRNRRLADRTIQEHPRVTATQAAAMAGVSPSALSHMMESGCLPSQTALFRSGKRARTLHVEAVRLAADAAQGACTL